jgi:SNF2 family DNA or RNA helicase
MPDTLFPCQVSAIEQLLEGKRGVFHPYGLGKTWSALATIHRMCSYPYRILVLCKKRNIITWKRELHKRLGDNIYIYELWGSPKRCKQEYHEMVNASTLITRVVLLSYSVLARELQSNNAFFRIFNPHAVIADEGTAIKTPKARVTKAALKLSKMLPSALKIVLTGNPWPEGYYEIWSQLEFTGVNPFRETTYYYWLRNWFVKPDFGQPVLLNDKVKTFWEKCAKVGVWISEKDLMEMRSSMGMPRDQYISEFYTFSKAQSKLLKRMYNEWSLARADGSLFDMNYALSINTKAQQVCSGFYYDDEKDIVHLVDDIEDNSKAVALKSVIVQLFKENPKRKIIIWRKYIAEAAILMRILHSFVDASTICWGPEEDEINMFLKIPERNIIVMPIDVSTGFNELVVADAAIYFSNDFSQEKRNQAEGRISRIGQQQPYVLHIDLVSPDGRDAEVVTALQSKNLTTARLRTITNRYLNRS